MIKKKNNNIYNIFFFLKKKIIKYKNINKKFLKKFIFKYKNIKNKIKKNKKKKLNNYIRLLSDYQNQYKRFKKERINILKFSNKELILNILIIIEDFKRSFIYIKKKKKIYIGIKLIYKKFLNILKNYGLKKNNTKIGDKFDYIKHEIIGKKKSIKFKNKIIKIIENGYLLNDSLIKYDKVIVGY
ncbi:MAG: nucleotide exchange factor GrpE [Candidatus Shikimatogenerans sp. Tder]|uniref:Protein GrpE n=1 Tax=Candidatus Shikimatogenerans sp. Tder TaxID=3158566 RepID=A0AAU7QRF2_9FLAO